MALSWATLPAWAQAQPAQQLNTSQQSSPPQSASQEAPATPDRELSAIDKPIGSEVDTLDSPVAPPPRITKPASIVLKVAAWNFAARKLSEATESKTAAAPTPKKWRNTFGSERTTAKWREHGKAGFTADIIALQGVTSYRSVRRLFNARHYQVIVSRQLLARSTSTSTGIAVFRADAPPTTAIVFRRRRGVRAAGFRHFLPRTTRSQPEAIAITAFRIRMYGAPLWIASLDMPATCTAALAAVKCQPYSPVVSQLEDWAKRQKSPLLLLGHWPQYLIERLKNAGIETRAQTAATAHCAPPATGMFVAAHSSAGQHIVRLDNASVAKSNPCISTADLTLNLR